MRNRQTPCLCQVQVSYGIWWVKSVRVVQQRVFFSIGYTVDLLVHRAPIINKRGKDKKETFIVTSTSLSVLCVSVHELLEITITVSAAHQRELSESNLLSTSDRWQLFILIVVKKWSMVEYSQDARGKMQQRNEKIIPEEPHVEFRRHFISQSLPKWSHLNDSLEGI